MNAIMLPWFAILFSAGNGADLLTLIPSKAYWQAKGVEMTAANMVAALQSPASQPEGDAAGLIQALGDGNNKVATAAAAKLRAMGPRVVPALREAAKSPPNEEAAGQIAVLIEELSGRAQAGAIRRLMAIRALGELKAADALPALRKLLDSKALFEAEYAGRAVAAIDGKPFAVAAPSAKALSDDLWLLPGNCGAVGQFALGNIGAAGVGDLPSIMAKIMGDADSGKGDAFLQELNGAAIKLAEQVGNLRLHGLSVGVSDDVSNNDTGFAVLVFRGLYDRDAVRAYLTETGLFGDKAAAEEINGVEVLVARRQSAYILPSDEQFIIVGGPAREHMPLGAIVDAVKAGKGKLGDNVEMARLIKSVDPTSHAWAAIRVNDNYAKAPLLAGLKEVVVQVRVAKDKIDASAKAVATQPDQPVAAVTALNDMLKKALAQLAPAVKATPQLKPIADMLAGVQVTTKGAEVNATAQLKCSLSDLIRIVTLTFTERTRRMEADMATSRPDFD